MLSQTITRNLIGLEDLLVGEGSADQTRAGVNTSMTKINAQNFPYATGVTLGDRLLELETLAESLSVVDTGGNFLTGFLNTSDNDLDLAGRLWRKTPSASVAEIFYDDVRVLQYHRVTGDLILPPGTDYIAADAVVVADQLVITNALSASLTSAYIAADMAIMSVLGSAALLDVGTGADQVIQLDGAGKLPAVDGSSLLNIGMPVGAVIATIRSTPNTGFLECNGTDISRTTYAALFAIIGTTYGIGDGLTTFGLPDLRGEFIRGWDNSRGIDAGRSLGSTQADELKSHNHTLNGDYGSDGGGYVSIDEPNGGAKSGVVNNTGGSETRPRNVALMYQIKVL